VFTQLVGNEAADSLVSRFSRELEPQWFRVLEATISGQELSKSAHRVW